MRSIQANYFKIQNRNPLVGSYLCLTQAVKYKNYGRKSLLKALQELVPEDEYLKEETKKLVDHLVCLTKPSEEGESDHVTTQIRGITALKR
jgi:hypothetical protein